MLPARLKGLLDRVLTPEFAFREIDGRYEPLLTGRAAHLITTMDTPIWVYRFIYYSPGVRALSLATLGFCGIKPVEVSRIGPVKPSTRCGLELVQAGAPPILRDDHARLRSRRSARRLVRRAPDSLAGLPARIRDALSHRAGVGAN